MGTITYVDALPEVMGGERQISARWDSGSNLAMIEGHDQYEIIYEKEGTN